MKTPDGITHSVDVFASSIFDAIVEAIVAFHAGGLNARRPGEMTEFQVAVIPTPVQHTVRLRKVLEWLNGKGGSPVEHLDRERAKKRVKEALAE